MSDKNFVAVRTKYYKVADAKKEIGHSLRIGEHAKNENVKFPDDSHKNIYTFDESKFDDIEARHKESIGKKPQKNRNAVFEHVLVFSEAQFNKNDPEAHKKQIEAYMEAIKDEYGFEPMGFGLHLDEGHIDKDGIKHVNTHAHVYFYNFDFKTKTAPLRKLMIKGKNEQGQVNKLNPNFSKMQDIAGQVFECLGYKRGNSKLNTMAEHSAKLDYLAKKLKNAEGVIEDQAYIIKNQQAKIEGHNNLLLKLETVIKEKYKWLVKSGINFIRKHSDKTDKQIKNANRAINKRADEVGMSPELEKLANDTFDELSKQSDNKLVREFKCSRCKRKPVSIENGVCVKCSTGKP